MEKEIINKKKITEIVCPNCNRKGILRFLVLTPYCDTNFKIWKCLECSFFWEENWFNVFSQFEHLVKRSRYILQENEKDAVLPFISSERGLSREDSDVF